MEYPSAYINFRIYEDSVNEIGLAKVSLPEITNKVISITGSGMMGDIEVPLMGMMENMSLGLNFLSHTDPDAFARLMEQRKHQLDIRVAEEYWETEEAEVGFWADKYVVICRPKSMKPGGVAPATGADSSGEFTVYYYAAYRNGTQLWEIDKRNMKCVINGTDYMADVRKALGYF